jgi:hypothetical protein
MKSSSRCCGLWGTRPIPLKDELTLTSWQKWAVYHRFPFKMLFDGVTAVVCVVSDTERARVNKCSPTPLPTRHWCFSLRLRLPRTLSTPTRR